MLIQEDAKIFSTNCFGVEPYVASSSGTSILFPVPGPSCCPPLISILLSGLEPTLGLLTTCP